MPENLLRISTAVALHGRDVHPWKETTDFDFILRFTDEIQEWQRELRDAISPPKIDRLSDGSIKLTFPVRSTKYDESHKEPFNFSRFLADKIVGVAPVARHAEEITLVYLLTPRCKVSSAAIMTHVSGYKWLIAGKHWTAPTIEAGGLPDEVSMCVLKFEPGHRVRISGEP